MDKLIISEKKIKEEEKETAIKKAKEISEKNKSCVYVYSISLYATIKNNQIIYYSNEI